MPQPSCDTFKLRRPRTATSTCSSRDASLRQAVEVHQRPGRRRARRPGRVLGADLGQGAGQAGRRSPRPWPRPPRWATTCGTRCTTSTSRRSATASARPPARPAPARTASHYLLSWYYAWGGAHRHRGRLVLADRLQPQPLRLPEPARGLGADQRTPALKPQVADRGRRLGHQPRPAAGVLPLAAVRRGRHRRRRDQQLGRRATRTPPAGTPTFYGMSYDRAAGLPRPAVEPVVRLPGLVAWSGSPSTTTQTGNAKAKALLDKWVAWALANTTLSTGRHLPDPVRRCTWTGQPDTWNAVQPRRQHRPARHRRRLHQRRRRGRRATPRP